MPNNWTAAGPSHLSMPAQSRRELSRTNPCPRGHQMRLQHVELPPRQVVRGGGIGGWKLERGYRQWVCDTCGHRGIPLSASG